MNARLPLLLGMCIVACAPSAEHTTRSPIMVPSSAPSTTFVDELARGDWEHAKTPFDAAMTAAMPPSQLRALWEKLESDGGRFHAVEGTSQQSRDGYQVALVTCKFARLRKTLRIVFDRESKVAGIFYGPVTAEIDTKTRAFIDAASSGKFDVAVRDFDGAMKGAMPPATLAETWKQLEAKVGPLKAVETIELKPDQGYWASLATTQFERERFVIRVVYDGRNEIAGLSFLPAPVAWTAPPYASSHAFDEHDVTVGTSPALPGTLSVPKGKGPFPAIVLVHGSGPNDRDETVGGVKVFKDLAWGLASKGIAVLRYVKRSKQSPAGIVTQKEEVLDGARDAIELLRKTASVDSQRIFVAGHSQGGYLAPRIAEANQGLAGVVILAGSTIPLEDSILEQLTYFASLAPNNASLPPQIESARAFKQLVASPDLRGDQDVHLPIGGAVAKGAYFLDVRGYEPHVLAQRLACPLLILQGERDYQVTMKDFAGWKKTLGSKKNATLRAYPSLNHLFVSGTGTPSPAEYEAPGHVDAQVVADIAEWIVVGKR